MIMTATEINISKVGKGIFMSSLYGLGHACVVASIALGLLLMSFALPQGAL